jgi:hypothetical protein
VKESTEKADKSEYNVIDLTLQITVQLAASPCPYFLVRDRASVLRVQRFSNIIMALQNTSAI